MQHVISLSLPQGIFIARRQKRLSHLWIVKMSTATLCSKKYARDSLSQAEDISQPRNVAEEVLSPSSFEACWNFLRGQLAVLLSFLSQPLWAVRLGNPQ